MQDRTNTSSANEILTTDQIQSFSQQGYLLIPSLIDVATVKDYQIIYENFLSGRVDTQDFRSDLSGIADSAKDSAIQQTQERITQIMVPSRLQPSLLHQAIHQRCLAVSHQLLGDDLALDFDMLIDKPPYSNTKTPWHQDSAYWLKLPDTRALSCWVALDKATVENGCMWYVPGSHLHPMRAHKQSGNKGALSCTGDEAEAVAMEVNPGDCIVHHGNTLHYSRGNSVNKRRRAFITNFRPQAMVELERNMGYDHTGGRSVKNTKARGSTKLKRY